jgi:hypothetical protein
VACGLWTASHVSRAVNFFDLSKADVMPLAAGWSGSANSPPERVQWPPSKVILCPGAMDNFFGFRQIVDK